MLKTCWRTFRKINGPSILAREQSPESCIALSEVPERGILKLNDHRKRNSMSLEVKVVGRGSRAVTRKTRGATRAVDGKICSATGRSDH